MPGGAEPKCVKSMRVEYPEIPRQMFVCSKHGKWLTVFDDLFPVYWENNKCHECK